MNALVASVIRTYTPIIVGQIVAWLILIHIPVLPQLTVLVTAIVGGSLSAVYYTLVRVLEQQWPKVGVLLGLPSSPDSYSKAAPLVITGLPTDSIPPIPDAPDTSAKGAAFDQAVSPPVLDESAAATAPTLADPTADAPVAPVAIV